LILTKIKLISINLFHEVNMKIFIVPYPKNFNTLYHCPRGHEIVLKGLQENRVELVSSYDEADFAILDYVPHNGNEKFTYDYIKQYESKLVCIDWIDEPDLFIYSPEKCQSYFKRSYCISEGGNPNEQLITRRKEIDNDRVIPFAYCALPEFDIHSDIKLADRPIQLGVYLRPTCPNRYWTLQVVEQIAKQLGVTYHVGPVNDASRSVGTKCHYDSEYLNYLANTQIIVTCQPTGWEGDSRLWEALSSGALVISDRIFTQYAGRPEVLQYDIGNSEDLFSKIYTSINNLELSQMLAKANKNYTINYNTPKARMKHVLDHLHTIER
jgi:hypothetical protein